MSKQIRWMCVVGVVCFAAFIVARTAPAAFAARIADAGLKAVLPR